MTKKRKPFYWEEYCMNDVFIERMIRKKFEGMDLLITVGALVGVVLLGALGFFLGFFVLGFPMLTVLVAAASVFGAYKLIGSRLLEYEYSLTNGYLSVDKIMNRQTRKRMTAFECESCEDIGPYAGNEQRLKNRSFDTRVFATQFDDRRDAWYMIVRGNKTGKTLVVFNPDEELLEGIKQFIPRSLKFEKFGR